MTLDSLDVRTSLFRLFIISIFTVIWTLFIPGVAAARNNTLFEEGFLTRIPKQAVDAHNQYMKEQNRIKTDILNTKTLISEIMTSKDESKLKNLENLINVKKIHEDDLRNLKAPVVLKPFFLGTSMQFWPTGHFFLLIILFVFSPLPETTFSKKFLWRVFKLGVLVAITYRWPTWVRNIWFTSGNRTVFTDANFDVHALGFWIQELHGLTFSFLIAAIWTRWMDYDRDCIAKAAKIKENVAISNDVLGRLTAAFIQWQVCSVMLFLAFFGYTKFFWDAIFQYGDSRYVVHGIIVQLLWMVTWLVLSIPLFRFYYKWYVAKMCYAVSLIDKTTPAEERDIALRAIEKLEPFTFSNFVVTTLAALGSFLVPVLQSVFRI